MKYTHLQDVLLLNSHICTIQRGSPCRAWQLCPPKVQQLLDSHAESERVHPDDDSFVGQVQRLLCFFCCCCDLFVYCFLFIIILWHFLFARFACPENSTQFWHLYLFQRAPVLSPQCVLSYNRWTREGGQTETMDGYGPGLRLELGRDIDVRMWRYMCMYVCM